MEVTRVPIYELTVSMECGCKAIGRFKDAAYTEVETYPVFTPCESDAADPGIKMLSRLLTEMVGKEAKETKPPVAATPAPTITSAGQVDTPDTAQQAAPEGGTVVPIPVINRPHRPNNRPNRPAGTGGGPMIKTLNRAPVTGSGPLSPNAAAVLAARQAAAKKVAGHGGLATINSQGGAPDSRVVALLEETLFAGDPVEDEDGIDDFQE